METDKLIDAIGMIDDDKILNAKSSVKNIKKRSLKRTIILFAAVILCLTFSFTALAAASDPFYQILYRISPSVAQALKPVNLSCEDKGIKMEILSAAIYEDEAVIYISLQDLEQDRIDETVDLFDSYRINRAFDCSASCRRVDYDKSTKTAIFMINISQWNDEKITGDKITFSLREFISKKSVFEGELTELDLQSAEEVVGTTAPGSYRGGVGLYGYKLTMEQRDKIRHETKFLSADKDGIYAPTDSVKITGIGFIENKLHIQVYYDDILTYDNHGYINLVDKDGNDAPKGHYSFWDENNEGSYQEIIFDVTPEEIDNYTAYGNFVSAKNNTKGNWQVTFPLENKDFTK